MWSSYGVAAMKDEGSEALWEELQGHCNDIKKKVEEYWEEKRGETKEEMQSLMEKLEEANSALVEAKREYATEAGERDLIWNRFKLLDHQVGFLASQIQPHIKGE